MQDLSNAPFSKFPLADVDYSVVEERARRLGKSTSGIHIDYKLAEEAQIRFKDEVSRLSYNEFPNENRAMRRARRAKFGKSINKRQPFGRTLTVKVDVEPGRRPKLRYLHPTKGWRAGSLWRMQRGWVLRGPEGDTESKVG